MHLYTDGSCSPNPGRGCYAWVELVEGRVARCYRSRIYQSTTNNRMELSAAISAATFIILSRQSGTIYSDSNYLVTGLNVWSRS